ncbi:pentapeptide repeat-containing protein [Pseudomonas sp. PDM17]|nr:pentapeptide repeat-containing protein [Pseudomonas sp. PDM17]
MSNFPDTPSFAAFKADAKRLHKDARKASSWALEMLKKHGFGVEAHDETLSSVNLNHCQHALAAAYGSDFQSLQLEDQLIAKYIDHCYRRGYWSIPYSCSFNRPRFTLQLEALLEAFRDKVSLNEAGLRRGVDFAGFHFSELLFSRIAIELELDGPPDFVGIRAPGALFEQGWLSDVDSMEDADLRGAKFYSVTVDPAVLPGANCYQTDFSRADLRGADFRRSYLRGSVFRKAKLDGTDFRNCVLYECNFTSSTGEYRSGRVDASDWSVRHLGRFRVS